MASGAAMLLAYVAKYVSKFSDANYDEWFNDEAAADSVAWRVLKEYHPLEPEMILQLAGANFRQWGCGTASRGLRHLVAPDGQTETSDIRAYIRSKWRREDMSLLEFLRKSNKKGEIAGWLRKKFRELENPGPEQTLESFANEYVMHGEQLVAVDALSRMNDKFFLQWLTLHVPFRRLEDLRRAEVAEKVPSGSRGFAHALRITDEETVPEQLRGFWRRPELIAEEMRHEAHHHDYVQDILCDVAGRVRLVDMYLTGVLQLDAPPSRDAQGPRGADASGAGAGEEKEKVVYNAEQKLFQREIEKRVDLALRAKHSRDEEEADEARDIASRKNRPVVCLGPPGTGKTTVVLKCISDAAAKGARVLFALPTAQLAARMRSRLTSLGERVEVDTCHAAFKLEADDAERLPLMTPFDVVIVDEVSLLDQPQFEVILRMWHVADKIPALVFLGDKYQLPGMGATRPWDCPAWSRSHLRFVKLHHAWRCKDKAFGKILATLRTSRPTKKSRIVEKICRGHKAWIGDKPDKRDITKLLKKHPDTTIVTCTRRAASEVNDLAVEALFGRRMPLATLPGDVETNSENYVDGQLDRSGRKLKPSEVPVYKGMKLFLTKNIRKADDYVNGMACVVQQWYEAERCLRVKTATGKQLMITPWTDVDHGRTVYYPIRLGYAGNVHKIQGDELSHVTVYLDIPNMPAAGYTALSRVETADDYLIGGTMTVHHFVPAM